MKEKRTIKLISTHQNPYIWSTGQYEEDLLTKTTNPRSSFLCIRLV